MPENTFPEVMAQLGLNFNPAQNAIKFFEGRVASLNLQLSQMKMNAIAGARDINRAFTSQLGGMGGIGSSGNTSLGLYGFQLKSIQQQAQNAGTSIRTLANQVKNSNVPNDPNNIFAQGFQRRAEWFLSGSIFFGMVNGATQAVKAISDVEMGITQIARVSNDATFSFNNMRDSILQLGVDYGTTFDKVQNISLRWTQAGYNVADTLTLTKTALLAMNTAELNAEQSTVGFIAIMSQWGLEAKDLQITLDKINKVGDDFAVTSQDLVDGLTRASSAAKIMGLNIDQTIGLLTTMREASGRTGKEVGSALNSILSYIQRPGSINIMESMGIKMFADQAKTQFRNVMEVFSELAARWNDPSVAQGAKDALMAGAQAAGLFSQELADATGTQDAYAQAVQATTEAQGQFNDVEKRDAAQAAAGIYRRNYFIGLLERFATVSKVQLSIDQSSGYSARENAKTMETLEKKYDALKVAVMQLAVALGDSGLTAILKALVDAGAGALEVFSAFPKELQDFILATTGVFVAVKTVQSVLGLLGVTLGATAIAQKAAAAAAVTDAVAQEVAAAAAVQTSIAQVAAAEAAILRAAADKTAAFSATVLAATTGEAAVAAGAFTAAQVAGAVAAGTLTAAQGAEATAAIALAAAQEVAAAATAKAAAIAKAAALATPILLGISVAVGLIALAWGAVSREAEKAAKFIETTKSEIKSLSDQKSGLKELSAEYDTLKGKESLTADEKLRLLKVQQELVSLYGVSITGINAEGVAYSDSFPAIKLRNDEIERGIRLEKEKLKIAVQAKDASDVKDIQKSIDKIQEDLDKIKELQRAIEWQSQSPVIQTSFGNFYSQKAKEELVKLIDDMDVQTVNLKTKSINRQQTLQNDADNIIKTLETNGPKVSNAGRTFAYELAESLSMEGIPYETQLESLKVFINTLESSGFEEKFAKFSEAYKKAVLEGDTKGIDDNSKAIGRLTDEVAAANPVLKTAGWAIASSYGDSSALKKSGVNVLLFANNLEELNKSLDSSQSSLKDIASLYNQVADGQALSSDQMIDLIQNYPEVLSYMDSEGNLMLSQLDLLKLLFEAEKQNAIQKQQNAKDNADATVKSLETQRDAYLGFYRAMGASLGLTEEQAATMLGFDKKTYDARVQESKDAQAKINALNNLTFKSYDGKSSKSDSSSKANKPLQDALALIEHKKALEQESTVQEIADLNKILNTVKMNTAERWDIEERLYNAKKTLQDEALQNSVNWINEKKSFDQLSANEEIAAWNRVLANQKDNIEARKEATVNLYRLEKELREESIQDYTDKLKEEQDSLKDAYDSRMDMIDQETETKKNAQQIIIDGIEKELQLLDRKEDRYDYDQKKADLLAQRKYHELRTGEEHRKAIEDIDKQLDELAHDRGVDLTRQGLEDEKQAAEDKIDSIEETAKKEKKTWGIAYKDLEDLFDTHNLEIIAKAAASSKDAYQKWVDNYLVPMQNALAKGDVEGFTKAAAGAQESINKMDIYKNASSILDLKKQYEIGGDKSAAVRAKAYYDELEKLAPRVADELHNMNYKQAEERLKTLDQAHTGAETLSYGAAYLKPGELIFPPNLSTDLKTLIAVLPGFTAGRTIQQSQSSTTDNRKQVNLNGPLLNIEHNSMEDEVDATMFSRELKRVLTSMV